MRKRFFSIIVCVVMLFTMNVTAFAAETQENYSETEKKMCIRDRGMAVIAAVLAGIMMFLMES